MRQLGHRWKDLVGYSALMTARLMAGRVGWGGPSLVLFFPRVLLLLQTPMLQEGVGDHSHEGVAVQALPGSSFKMIEAEFLLHLLMSLFAHPARLHGARQGLERRFEGEIGQVIFALP